MGIDSGRPSPDQMAGLSDKDREMMGLKPEETGNDTGRAGKRV